MTLLLLPIWSFGQSLTDKIVEIAYQQPIMFDDLSFVYESTDTVTGVEIALVYKKTNRCNINVLFIENTNFANLDTMSLDMYLESVDTSYHRINFGYFRSLYDCNYTTPDTFYYCGNDRLYLERNFDHYLDKATFFRFSKDEIFSVFKTTVVLDRFRSSDVQHAKYYYHFIKDLTKLTSIEKVHFRQVLKREPLTGQRLLKAKRWNNKLVECFTTAH